MTFNDLTFTQIEGDVVISVTATGSAVAIAENQIAEDFSASHFV